MRTKYSNKRPLCSCGCKIPVGWHKRNKHWNVFIYGHNRKGITGLKFSKEHKRKLSKAHKEIKFSEEHKRKLSKSAKELWKSPEYIGKHEGKNNPFYGKSHSEKIKIKIGKSIKELWKSPKNLLKISGKNNANWKGGIACSPYCDVWLDKEYKQSIRDRDNNKCQNPNCLTKHYDRLLDIHHIDYIKKNCVPKNLITLCRSCNIKANKNRKQHTKFYQKIIEQKYKLKEAA